MARGIMILGLNGCGKTTIGRMLADQLHFFQMDAEDYYFPIPGDYSHSRSEEEVHRMMETDIRTHEGFVLSCVRCNVSGGVLQHIRLTVVLRASPELRAARIHQREIARFGKRVLPGGDMYQSRQTFAAFAAGRTEDIVDRSLERLLCPIVEMNAGLAPEEIIRQICIHWSKIV